MEESPGSGFMARRNGVGEQEEQREGLGSETRGNLDRGNSFTLPRLLAIVVKVLNNIGL